MYSEKQDLLKIWNSGGVIPSSDWIVPNLNPLFIKRRALPYHCRRAKIIKRKDGIQLLIQNNKLDKRFYNQPEVFTPKPFIMTGLNKILQNKPRTRSVVFIYDIDGALGFLQGKS